jgi:hypothetical protein
MTIGDYAERSELRPLVTRDSSLVIRHSSFVIPQRIGRIQSHGPAGWEQRGQHTRQQESENRASTAGCRRKR